MKTHPLATPAFASRLIARPLIACSLMALGGCAVAPISGTPPMPSDPPITHSHAAPQIDSALGSAVRQAQVLQTLRPEAGTQPQLPQTQRARAALPRLLRPASPLMGSGMGSGTGPGTGSEPGHDGAAHPAGR